MRVEPYLWRFKRLQMWAGKGFWAVLDQGLFAGSNFILNILLARWLTAQDYGAFATAYAIFLLLGTLHTATLTEPMMIFGSGKYNKCFRDYLGIIVRRHWEFTAILTLVLLLAGAILWQFTDSPLTPLLFGLALVNPFILFQWLMRRACYVNLQPQLSAFAGAVYVALMIFGVFLLYVYDTLSAISALGVMATASYLSALWLVGRLKPSRSMIHPKSLVEASLHDHLNYSRWAVGTSVLSWIPGNVFYLLLPLWGSFEATAVLRALSNLMMPIWHINSAIASVLLPTFVRLRANGNFRQGIWRITALLAGMSALYVILLLVNHQTLLHLLYDGQYDNYRNLLWIFLPLLIPNTISTVLAAGLRALEKPDGVFWTKLVDVSSTFTQGLILTIIWGLQGLFFSYWISAALTVGMIMRLLLKAIQKEGS